ncbi:hypothetical protein B0H13DRAFT_2402981 [Mycena leptocephala]|nr:hypothetical protein B0H13DRAFT_2402981 [Mycena leptocephala]
MAKRKPKSELSTEERKPKKMPSVQQETRNGVALRPRSTADAASGADDSSGEEFYDESRDADYLPGERTVKERRAASRKASARHYKEDPGKEESLHGGETCCDKSEKTPMGPSEETEVVVLQEETSVSRPTAIPDKKPVSRASHRAALPEPSPDYTFHSSASQSPSRSQSPASSSYSASPTVPLLSGAVSHPRLPPALPPQPRRPCPHRRSHPRERISTRTSLYILPIDRAIVHIYLVSALPARGVRRGAGSLARLTQSWGELQAEIAALRAEMRAVAELEALIAARATPRTRCNISSPVNSTRTGMQMDVDALSPPGTIVDGARTMEYGNREPPRSRKFSSAVQLASA